MVKAILKDIKTNTRRPLKLPKYVQIQDNGLYLLFADGGNYANQTMDEIVDYLKPPYQKGDIRYVRETWLIDDDLILRYKADNDNPDCLVWGKQPTWRPSIHMPKEAARIFLKVTDVRVERLQDITNDGAIKEGFTGVECSCKGMAYACTDCYNTGWQEPPIIGFMFTWDAIYKNWSDNPWVWVIEFEKIEKHESEGDNVVK